LISTAGSPMQHWDGHWVVLNPNGTICGVNNGEDVKHQTAKAYTNDAPLMAQFAAYYEQITGADQWGAPTKGDWRSPVLVQHNPLKLANIM
jgi:hypothetical protein